MLNLIILSFKKPLNSRFILYLMLIKILTIVVDNFNFSMMTKTDSVFAP